MAEKVYNVRILQKQDSTDKWNSSPIILRNGEIGIEVLDDGKKKIKIGDGTSTWTDLDYLETEAAANILDGIANGSIRTSLAAAETADYRMGTAAFASGQNTKAQGNFSKATNFNTIASGGYSSAEGRETQAKGSASHAGGYGTIAGSKNQTVIGKFNVEDTSEEYAFIIGDGENADSRTNLFTVAWDGEVQVDGKKLATEEYVGQNGGKIDSISVNGNTQTITNKNVNITVPTKTSEITNDSDFATVSQIPTKTSQLTNDSNLATTSQIPTKVSQLENDKNYLTTHQDISGKADKTYVDSQITEANKYTDDSVANLLNNSSEAVDSIYELRDAMEDNKDAIEALTTIAGSKVDKVDGKGLSTNDYTTEEKNKLAGIAVGAQVNVQSDWNATSGDAMILNKPEITKAVNITIPAAWIRGDVNHDGIVDEVDSDLIKNGVGSTGDKYYGKGLSTLFPDGNIPLDYQAADVDNSGSINIDDFNLTQNGYTIKNGVTEYSEDLMGNWTFREDFDKSTVQDWYYYIDLAIEGIEQGETISVIFYADKAFDNVSVETISNAVRVYCKVPPTEEINCTIYRVEGSSSVLLYRNLSKTQINKIDNSIQMEIEFDKSYDVQITSEMNRFSNDIDRKEANYKGLGSIVFLIGEKYYPAFLIDNVIETEFVSFGVIYNGKICKARYSVFDEVWKFEINGKDYNFPASKLFIMPYISSNGIPVTIFGEQIATGPLNPIYGLHVASSTEDSTNVFQIKVDDEKQLIISDGTEEVVIGADTGTQVQILTWEAND